MAGITTIMERQTRIMSWYSQCISYNLTTPLLPPLAVSTSHWHIYRATPVHGMRKALCNSYIFRPNRLSFSPNPYSQAHETYTCRRKKMISGYSEIGIISTGGEGLGWGVLE